MAYASLPIAAAPVRCRVCGCGEVRTDEVLDGETLLLAECPRCDHRWTARAPHARVRKIAPRNAMGVSTEAATAA